jgi:DNA-binding NarL/FixJ family response regulator
MKHLLLVDDHPIVRQGLRQVLTREPDLDVCGEASCAGEAIALFESTNPDAVVVDMSLGRESGLDVIAALRARSTTVALLALSMHDELMFAERALRAGANGYVMKDAPVAVLLGALRRVLEGNLAVGAAVTERLLRSLPSHARSGTGVERLSDRELQVFRLIGDGMRTTDIATELAISPKTVETHRARIKEKLGVESATELVVHAVEWTHHGAAPTPLSRRARGVAKRR